MKNSRCVEFPVGITKAELVTIILKMVPKVVGDEDKSPYTISGADPTTITDKEGFADSFNLMDSIKDFFGGDYDDDNDKGNYDEVRST